MILPDEFLSVMKEMLGNEYDDFLESYKEEPKKGIRLNTLKSDICSLENTLGVKLSKTAFSPFLYATDEIIKTGKSPAFHAGMYYSQEPSAASAVTVLSPKPGEKVLDLCAAPGGKSTQIASLLNSEGLIWSNEIVKSRAKILISNIERMGIKNSVVSSCHPQRLCEKLRGYFDKVLVDAPCSGEGMFRKDEKAISDWSREHVLACAERQAQILDSASLAVKEGGELVYSTCTFSHEENEGIILAFLKRHPDFELLPVNTDFGRRAIGIDAIRIFPMDKAGGVSGEGHFVAKLRRTSRNDSRIKAFDYKITKQDKTIAEQIYIEIFKHKALERIFRVGDSFLLLPEILPDTSGLGVLRAGVELAYVKGKRLEPAHAVFMSRVPSEVQNVLSLDSRGDDIAKFLHGEEIESSLKGYTAVAVNGSITGFGKSSGGRLKNKYPKGLRTN